MSKAAARKPSRSRLGTLPRWDLSDLYDGPGSPRLKDDLARARRRAEVFHRKYFGRVERLSGRALGEAVATYEAIDELLARIISYSQLLYAGDMTDPEIGRFHQTIREQVTEIASKLVFFPLELNRIEDAALARKMKAKELARYAPWVRDQRVFRPHQLDEAMERLLHEKQVTGRASWVRLFDETLAAMRFPVEGKSLTVEEALHRLSDPSRARRKAAALALGKGLGGKAPLFAMITNTLAKDKEIEDRWRRYPRPQSWRNLSNHVEDEVVDALVAAVRDGYPRLSHRYYRMKARWLGRPALDYWDRNAPLPEAGARTIPWTEAKTIVLDAYGAFSPELASTARRFFDHAWIDAPARPGKAPGAFAHPVVPSVHPYLLLNYLGRPRDVMTLAHELGHGVHQVLAASQGHLKSDTPLTLAETASVFGEMLTFRALLVRETDHGRRKALLASKVEDMINTVVRQIAFYEFESRVHTERSGGELALERLCDIWISVQRESLGPAFRFHPTYRWYWTYIPHFIHSPFYVYAYAFGDCLVNALYAVYREAEQGFAERYLAMLRAGGTLHHRELLAPFGLDARDPGFWAKGLGIISDFIDELEAMG